MGGGRVLARASVLVGVEAVAGTYLAPTEVLKIESAVMPTAEMDVVETPNFSFYGGMKDSTVIADWAVGKLDITTSLYKSLAYSQTLLEICNLKKTAVTLPFVGFAFTPNTHATTTASIDIVLPDRKFKYQGAKSSFKLSGKVGDKVNVSFGIQGSYVDRVIAPQTITDVPSDELMIIRRIGGMSINGIEINMSEFEFDMGSTINQEKFTNVGAFNISDFSPKLTIKTRLEDGESDGFDELLSGASMAFVADLKDAAGNVIWRLNVPKAKITKQPDFADGDGIYVISREYNALATTGDDNFTLYHFTH